MAKPHRSPLLGYNHNVSHLGRVFHVQTEDSGPASPRLFTHLFYEGTILASRKHEYDAMLPDDQVRALMQAQHRALIKDLANAIFNDKIVAFFHAHGEHLVVPAAPRAAAAPPAPVAPEAGAIPMAPMAETPGPTAAPLATAAAAAGPRRTTTRSLESPGAGRAGLTPAPVPARAPSDGYRPPFVRSGPPGGATPSPAVGPAASTGVVVQRSVVVGGTSMPSSPRPARIRPPVPYIVTGGSHPARPTSAGTGAAAEPVAPAPAPISAVEAPRPTSGFGAGLPDDKSLDEVILEYLSEDGD